MNTKDFFVGTVCINKDYFANKAFLRSNLINAFNQEKATNIETYEKMLLFKIDEKNYICINVLSLKQYLYLKLNFQELLEPESLNTENGKFKHIFIDNETIEPLYEEEKSISLKKVKKDYCRYYNMK